MNHKSEDPNLEVRQLGESTAKESTNRIVFQAKRKILAGEELTVDYSIPTSRKSF